MTFQTTPTEACALRGAANLVMVGDGFLGGGGGLVGAQKGWGCWPHAGGGSQHAEQLSPLLWCARPSSDFCCLRPSECARVAICKVVSVEILRFKCVSYCSQSLRKMSCACSERLE